MKTNLSDLTSDNGQNSYKIDKSCGPSRKTTSWTSTPDLTTLSDSVTSQIGKLKSKYSWMKNVLIF